MNLTTIARQARVMAEAPNSQTPERIPEMAKYGQQACSRRRCQHSSRVTLKSAKAVVKQDKKVDALNKEVRSVCCPGDLLKIKLTADSGLNPHCDRKMFGTNR